MSGAHSWREHFVEFCCLRGSCVSQSVQADGIRIRLARQAALASGAPARGSSSQHAFFSHMRGGGHKLCAHVRCLCGSRCLCPLLSAPHSTTPLSHDTAKHHNTQRHATKHHTTRHTARESANWPLRLLGRTLSTCRRRNELPWLVMPTASAMRGLHVVAAMPRCSMLIVGTHAHMLVSRVTEPSDASLSLP